MPRDGRGHEPSRICAISQPLLHYLQTHWATFRFRGGQKQKKEGRDVKGEMAHYSANGIYGALWSTDALCLDFLLTTGSFSWDALVDSSACFLLMGPSVLCLALTLRNFHSLIISHVCQPSFGPRTMKLQVDPKFPSLHFSIVNHGHSFLEFSQEKANICLNAP